ncbi:glycosyltransferase [Parabacteroides sp. OttesenSCG-928-N08]|nr:glycosyltransferase [Parabacteroides sp. OttesenSCG-928-N08]
MKRVLILCDMFPPAFGPRMGYLAKYLPENGWEPTVVTEEIPENMFAFLAGNCPVVAINYYSAKNKIMRKCQWLYTILLHLLFDYKERRMYKVAKRLHQQQPFDLILCSSFQSFPLTAARWMAEEYGIPLVVDLRDIIEQYSGEEYIKHKLPRLFGLDKWIKRHYTRRQLSIRNRALQVASYVTTISPWHVEQLKHFNPNVTLIYNGYDPELFYPVVQPTPHFTITYTGRLLSAAMRDPSLLFEALARLSSDGILQPTDCRVVWYVDEQSQRMIKELAAPYQIDPFMHYKGYVAASEIPAILNRSSLLLILTNRASQEGPKGVMTTKFFESLAVEKPLLCVRSDESYLAAAIHATQAGVAASTVEEVTDFLVYHYYQWKEWGYTFSRVNREALSLYSRREQARQFATIFHSLSER